MRYKTQAVIGILGAIFSTSLLATAYLTMQEVSWIIPAFTLAFTGGFIYYAVASLKEKKQKKEERKKK